MQQPPPPPYAMNRPTTGTVRSATPSALPRNRSQSIPPLLTQMAREFNIPEATIDLARQGSEANLVLSTLALSFQQLQAENEQLRTENDYLIAQGANGTCPAMVGGGRHPRLLPTGQRFSPSEELTSTLLAAAEARQETLMKLILSHVDVDVNARNSTQRTVLHYAADGVDSIVELLLQHPDIDPDPRIHHGTTPLLLAAEMGHSNIVRLLLEHGGVDVNARDADGDTVLANAAIRGDEDVLKLLLAHAPTTINVNVVDKEGRCPLSFAVSSRPPARYPHNIAIKTEAKVYAVTKLLLQYPNVAVNLADKNGKRPLQYALEAGFSSVIQLIRSKGAV